MQNDPITNHAKYFLPGSIFNTQEVLSTVATFSPLCQNGDLLVLKAFSDKCSGIHWFKTNFLASIQVNSCHKNGCAKFDWSVPPTQFHITPPPLLFQWGPQFTNQDFIPLKTLNVTQHKSFQLTSSQAQYSESRLGTSLTLYVKRTYCL